MGWRARRFPRGWVYLCSVSIEPAGDRRSPFSLPRVLHPSASRASAWGRVGSARLEKGACGLALGLAVSVATRARGIVVTARRVSIAADRTSASRAATLPWGRPLAPGRHASTRCNEVASLSARE